MLDEINKDFEWGVKVGGKGAGHNNLDDEQVEWLIKQTEKVEELKEIIADRTNDIIHQQTELDKTRQKNQKLRERNDFLSTLNCMYKKENEQLKSRMQFQEGFLEKIDNANEHLLKAIKSVVETEPQDEEDYEMVFNSIKSFLKGVLGDDF